MIIYKITNLVNGKCYIGQTTNSFEERYKYKGVGVERVYRYHTIKKRNGRYYNSYLLRSMNKYGIENFEVEIIDEAESQEELNNLEIYYIEEFDSFNYGYNLDTGGTYTEVLTGGNHPCSKEVINLDTGEIFNSIKEAGDKFDVSGSSIGGACARRHKKSAGYRWMYLDEYKIRGDIVGEVKYPHYFKPVINIDTGKKFKKMVNASNYYNISISSISSVCKGNHKSAGGYRWMYLDEYNEKGDIVGEIVNERCQEVINLDTKKTFNSIIEASKSYDIIKSSIVSCCTGNLKTAGGYRWMYLNEYKEKGDTVGEITNNKYVAVKNLDTGKEFKSITEACKYYKVDRGAVRRCCKGEQGTTGGYRWMYLSDYKSGNSPEKFTNNNFSPVKNIETGEEFKSIKEASEQCKIDKNSISRCCRGKRKTAGGYRWEYVD